MDQGKSQTKGVKTKRAQATHVSAAIAGAGGVARPETAGKLRGTGEAGTGVGSNESKTKPPKTAARATGAAASKAEAGPVPAAAPTELDQLVALLREPGGANLPELQSATGWQVHSVRGAMAGALRKKGYNVTSEKPEDGLRRYRITEAS